MSADPFAIRLLDDRHGDTLRRATRKLRDRAGKATVGPWHAHPDGLVWAPPPGDPVSGSEQVDDAQYIASVHPLVGLALADLFERTADTFLGAAEAGGSRDRLEHFADQMEIVRLARLYLGEST